MNENEFEWPQEDRIFAKEDRSEFPATEKEPFFAREEAQEASPFEEKLPELLKEKETAEKNAEESSAALDAVLQEEPPREEAFASAEPDFSSPKEIPHQAPAQPYSAQAYPGQPYPAQPYSGQQYPGQPYFGQQYPGQPYPAQQYPGQPYPGQPYPTQPYGSYPPQPRGAAPYYPPYPAPYRAPYPARPQPQKTPFGEEKEKTPLPEKKKMNKGLKVFLWILGGLVAACVIGFSAYGIYTAVQGGEKEAPGTSSSQPSPGEEDGDSPSSDSSKPGSSSQSSDINPNLPELEQQDQPTEGMLTAAEIYKKLKDSVVGVVIYDKDADLTSDPISEGSGVVVRKDGYILTNSHVINNSRDYNIKVVLYNAEEYVGRVVGYDSKTDLAVIKIDANNLVPAVLGNSDQLAVGNWVLALGNPGGMTYSSSLTRGIVSAVDRSVISTSSSIMTYIQTDAAINPGNSGGALVNMYGQVVGINTLKIVDDGYEGMGFAIPINAAKEIADDIIRQGYVSGRVRLGITGKEISEYQAMVYDVPSGFVIVDISEDSSLLSSEAKIGDIITHCNGEEIAGLNDLTAILIRFSPGDRVRLTLFRPADSGSPEKTFDVTVTLLEDKGETQEPVSRP